MVHSGVPQEPHHEALTTEGLAALYSDCIRAIRTGAPPEVWQDVNLRISELQHRLEKQAERVAACSFCGAIRPTSTLHVLDLDDSSGRQRFCFRCWQLLELGLKLQQPEADTSTQPTNPASLTDAATRRYIRAGAARLAGADGP